MIMISKKVIKEELEEILGEAPKRGADPRIRGWQVRQDKIEKAIDVRKKEAKDRGETPDIVPPTSIDPKTGARTWIGI